MNLAPVPLDQPYYGAPPTEAFRRFFKKYVTFEGRASRSEYWWVLLIEVLVFALLLAVHFLLLFLTTEDGPVSTAEAPWLLAAPILILVWILATILPSMSISWRRLHDAGFPGWLFLLSGLPVMNIVFLVFTLMPASPNGDRYNVGTAARPGTAQPLPGTHGDPIAATGDEPGPHPEARSEQEQSAQERPDAT